MQVLVIADEKRRQELMDKPLGPGIEYQWMSTADYGKEFPDAGAIIDLEFKPDPERLRWLCGFLPRPVLINSVTCTTAQTHPDFIRINAWPGFLSRKICEVSVQEDRKKNAALFFEKLGWEFRFVPDQIGMVSARVVACIINEAFFTLEAGVSSREDIDLAMKLGTNYPMGPFEWSAKIGLKNIHELLLALYNQDNKYRICDLLEKDLEEDLSK